MLSLTCHNCDEKMQAATEDELAELVRQHAQKHGHTPPRQDILTRIRRHNPS